jgi:hypothetical protein
MVKMDGEVRIMCSCENVIVNSAGSKGKPIIILHCDDLFDRASEANVSLRTVVTVSDNENLTLVTWSPESLEENEVVGVGRDVVAVSGAVFMGLLKT